MSGLREHPRIVVVGPGSMGMVHAALLHETGHDVALLDYRPERAGYISDNGVTISGAADLHAAVPAFADAEDIGPADLVIFFVKAYSTAHAVEDAAGCIGQNTALLTLQNGLGNIAHLQKAAADEHILAGTTSTGAYRTGQAAVELVAIGDARIGSVGRNDALARDVADLLTEAGLPAEVSDNVRQIIWTKAIINAGINPLGALMRVRNGVIPQVKASRLLQEELVAEAESVAEAVGIHFDEDLITLTRDICRQTAQNRCSMLQDLAAGRKTEIEQINGHIASEGRKHGCATPYNATITRLVKAVEQV